jgi:phospholipase C
MKRVALGGALPLHNCRRVVLAIATVSFGAFATNGVAASAAPTPYAPAARLLQAAPAPVRPALRPNAALRSAVSRLIKHVVIIMQENRGFNYLFKGYPGATTFSSGLNSKGQNIALQPISLAAPYDIDHESWTMFAACDGNPPGQNCKMDGFDLETVWGSGPPNAEYGYAPRSEVQTYWNMAGQYVIADMMFNSNLDASFVSHQYIIAGQANHEVNIPNYNWGCGGGSGDFVGTLNPDRSYGPNQSPCQNYPTLGDELTSKGLTWRYYTAVPSDIGFVWAAYQAVSHDYYGKAWKHTITPSSQVLTDLAHGTLKSMTWVLPDWANSDHSGNGSSTGPHWVTSVVNAIGQSKFWKSTAIFVIWDEWGGWYDGVAPPYVDYDGLGFRIPLMIISPYAKQGRVTHVQYEHGSLLRFVEDDFGLPQLAASDTRANDPAADPNAFDFTQKPRPFSPFAAKLGPSYFIHQFPSRHALDEQ